MSSTSKAVRFRINGGDVKVIREGEHARHFRHYWNVKHHWKSAILLGSELGTQQIHSRMSELRNRFGVVIDSKPGGGRRQKLYRLNPSVVLVDD